MSNSGSGAAAVESGSWVSIYGTNLATTTRPWRASDIVGTALPTTLDNVTVTIDGKKAVIAYVSPLQLNVQAPADTATGSVTVVVTNLNGTATGAATLTNYAPAFFTFQARYAAARHNNDGVAVAPTGFLGETPSRPATPGESIQIYATGLGPDYACRGAGGDGWRGGGDCESRSTTSDYRRRGGDGAIRRHRGAGRIPDQPDRAAAG